MRNKANLKLSDQPKIIMGGSNMSEYSKEYLLKAGIENFLGPLSPLGEGAKKGPHIFVKGNGIYLEDIDGKKYIDGNPLWLSNIGHGHTKIADSAREQMVTLEFFPSYWGYGNPPALALAKEVASVTPEGLDRVFFTGSGSEANETNIKIARLYHFLNGKENKTKLIAREGGFHGLTYGTLNVTGMPAFRKGFATLSDEVITVPAPYCFRCAFNLEYPECNIRCAEVVAEEISKVGADNIAAFVGESIMAVGGVIVTPKGYWEKIRAICDQNDVLIIDDEVVCGFGKTGKWFGCDHFDYLPDMMTVAKGLTSGYAPLGGSIISNKVYNRLSLEPVFRHGFTYSGHPVCCKVALANLEIIKNENLLTNVNEVGKYLADKFKNLEKIDIVGEVRNIGSLHGIELVKDKDTNDPASLDFCANLQGLILKNGMVNRIIGNNLVLSPSFMLTREEADKIFDIVNNSILEVI